MQTFPIATTKPALASAIPRLSPVSSQIVRLIARYRFINSHLIAPLIQADPSYVRHSLRQLYQKKLVNRFARVCLSSISTTWTTAMPSARSAPPRTPSQRSSTGAPLMTIASATMPPRYSVMLTDSSTRLSTS